MHLTPKLPPAGPKLDRGDTPSRERMTVEAPSTRSRFDEHLQQVDEQGRSSGTKRERGAVSRDSQPPAEPAGAKPIDPETAAPAVSGELATQKFAVAPEAVASPSAAAPEPQGKADSSEAAAEVLALQDCELEPGACAVLPESGEPASAPPPQAVPAPADPLVAALLSMTQALQPEPAAPARGLAAQVLRAAVDVEALSASEAGPTTPIADSPAALLQGADESGRAQPALPDGIRDFEAELTRLRESEAAQSPARAQAHREQAAEILRQVRVGLSPDLREANIQLAPESLGRVSIQLRIEDGVLHAEVRAQTPEALRALERHAPELRAALAQNGVEARSLEFQLETPSSRAGDGQGRGSAAHAQPARQLARHFVPQPLALERALTRGLSASGIDTFA